MVWGHAVLVMRVLEHNIEADPVHQWVLKYAQVVVGHHLEPHTVEVPLPYLSGVQDETMGGMS